MSSVGIDQIELGNYHSAIVLSDGRLLMSGANGSGQLGIGTNINQYSFTPVPGIRAIMASTGREHSAIINDSGELMVAGSNYKGQLGLDSSRDCLEFTKPSLISMDSVTLVRCASYTTLALTTYGELLMSGINILGVGVGDQLTFTSCNSILDIEDVRNFWIVNNDTIESVIILDHMGQLWHCQSDSFPELIHSDMDVKTVVNLYLGDDNIPLKDQSVLLILNYRGELCQLYEPFNPILEGVKCLVPSKDGNSACALVGNTLVVLKIDEDGNIAQEQLNSGFRKVSYNNNEFIMLTDDGKLVISGLNEYGQLGAHPFKDRGSVTIKLNIQ
jgi:alpha-tubulin suppressor-like RCC1 family protein